MKAKPPSRRRRAADLPEDLTKATRLIVATLREFGDDEAAIRRGVAGAFAKALAMPGLGLEMMDLGEHGAHEMVPLSGIFHLVLAQAGCDRADQRGQESWWAVVETAMDRTIKGELAGFDPPPKR